MTLFKILKIHGSQWEFVVAYVVVYGIILEKTNGLLEIQTFLDYWEACSKYGFRDFSRTLNLCILSNFECYYTV